MTTGKESARDARYGRRGGRWATDTGDAPTALAYYLGEIHRARIAALRADRLKTPEELADPRNREWPAESIPLWRAIADDPTHPLYEQARDVMKYVREEPTP